MNLIKIGNLIINASLLVEAEFTPAEKHDDLELGQIVRPAKLCLRFSAPQSETRTDYNGDYLRCEEAMPYSRTLRGEEAEKCWQELGGPGLRLGRI